MWPGNATTAPAARGADDAARYSRHLMPPHKRGGGVISLAPNLWARIVTAPT
jgi:hypothetical protein